MPATRSRRGTASGHRRSESYRSGGLTRPTTSNRSPIATSSSAFRGLPLDQRAVFVLHHHVGLPLVAVAETLGIPDGTARSRLHYATRALRAGFDEARAQATQREGRRHERTNLFERAVRDWLEDGSDRTPRPAIDAVLLAVKTT